MSYWKNNQFYYENILVHDDFYGYGYDYARYDHVYDDHGYHGGHGHGHCHGHGYVNDHGYVNYCGCPNDHDHDHDREVLFQQV